MTLTALALVVVGFVGMEAVTYVVHRFVMHGVLERLHLSHHRNAAADFADKSPEANDVFPLAFSAVVVAAFWLGFNVGGLAWLLPHGIGWTDGKVQMASIDHAMWFHRPFRADDWLLYDQASLSTSSARGLAGGAIFTRSGELVVSVVQEGLIRLVGKK